MNCSHVADASRIGSPRASGSVPSSSSAREGPADGASKPAAKRKREEEEKKPAPPTHEELMQLSAAELRSRCRKAHCGASGTKSAMANRLIARAAHKAGFKYINGIVGFHYLSMDLDARPDGWTDDAIFNGGHYHDASPVDLAHRMHPFMMADATDFDPDSDGVILANAGELGAIAKFAENENGEECVKSCPLTSEDVDIAIERIDESLSVRDPKRVFKVDLYLPLNLFTEKNRPVLQSFIEQVNTKFVDTGRLQWGTQRQVYEAYLAHNAAAS